MQVGQWCFEAVKPGALVKTNGIMDSTKYQTILPDNPVVYITRPRLGCRWTFPKRIPQNPHRNGSVNPCCNGHLRQQTSIQSKTSGLNWRGQLICINSRAWGILLGSLQMCSLTLSSITGKDSMLLSLPEVDAPSTKQEVPIIMDCRFLVAFIFYECFILVSSIE